MSHSVLLKPKFKDVDVLKNALVEFGFDTCVHNKELWVVMPTGSFAFAVDSEGNVRSDSTYVRSAEKLLGSGLAKLRISYAERIARKQLAAMGVHKIRRRTIGTRVVLEAYA